MKNPKFQISNFKSNPAFIGIMIIILAFLFLYGKASAELTISANHAHITIDFFYHGSTVGVSGISEPGTDLIIKITSPDRHETLKQKRKVGGLLWMNAGTLNFENVPALYLLVSTRKIEDIMDVDELDRNVIGYRALGKHVKIEPVANEEEKAKWFDELVKFKESSKLYSTSFGKISTASKDGKQVYSIKTDWPYQAPPGEYILTVYAVKDKRVTEKAETKVQVEQVGIVKTLSHMAKNKGALYGIISIVAALGAGFGVGLIFRKGGGAH